VKKLPTILCVFFDGYAKGKKKSMKKQLVIIGIIALLLATWLSD
jgi:hypothetical protein